MVDLSMADQSMRPEDDGANPATEESVAPRAPEVAGGRRRLLVGGFAAGPVLYAATTRSALALECRSPSQIFSGNLSQQGPATCTPGNPPTFWKQNFTSWVGADPPTIQRRSGSVWSDAGADAGNDALTAFTGTSSTQALARIKNTAGTYCLNDATLSNWDFGATFASIFGVGSDTGLIPVVPTMRALGATCNGAFRYTLDARPVSLWEVLAYPTNISTTVVDGIGLGTFAGYVAAAYLNKLANPGYPLSVGQILHMWNQGRTSAGFCPAAGCTAANAWYASRISQYLIATWTL